jgi:hypothetical protein
MAAPVTQNLQLADTITLNEEQIPPAAPDLFTRARGRKRGQYGLELLPRD